MSSYATPSTATPHHASTSANPNALTPASYHPAARPSPNPLAPISIPPFHRIDTHTIKQQLHDALGEAGLPYWTALNAYLLGQVGRDELVALVRGWLKGKNLQLHNQFLTSLLHNASSPQILHAPTSPLNMHKRRRGGGSLDAPDFDADLTFIEPKDRVRHWVMGLGGKERDRIRRAVVHDDDDDGDGESELPAADIDMTTGRKRKWSVYQTSAAHQPTLAQSSRLIPSSNQLANRLSHIAKGWGLDVAPDASSEVGEFMGVGLNAHLGDMLHSVVHLTGRDRPGEDTMRVPLGVKSPNITSREAAAAHPVPPPSLQTLQALFTVTPSLHPQASPALYKLESGLTIAEAENMNPPGPSRRATMPPPMRTATPVQPAVGLPQPLPGSALALTGPLPSHQNVSPAKAASTLHAAAGQGKIDTVSQTLQDTGLLKLDKAGHRDGDDSKREKKHNLHWKYEDPALILKDLLG